jgi:D-amino-acid oxidase
MMSASDSSPLSDTAGAVLVIGAGVSGLTSALCLRRRGFAVTVAAESFAPRITSVVAGALWEWPPAVCGYHRDVDSLARSKVWCRASHQIFEELARDSVETGVFVRPVTYYFKRPIAEKRYHQAKMEELKHEVHGFRHDPALIAEHGVNPIGLEDAYTHLAPMVDTDVYMPWLLREARKEGCRVVERKIAGPLSGQAESLAREFQVDAIVNCTGLGAKELTGEPMYPLRGALVRVRNDGRAMPRITQAHCISLDNSDQERGFIFIVPRGENTVVLGGLAEPNEWGLEIGLHNYEPVREMYQRCLQFMPALRLAEIDSAEPVRVGLRPVRDRNVRLESEPRARIVHNYGHGGSGVTFSWGCALEVVDLVERIVGADRAREGPREQPQSQANARPAE